MKEYTVIIERRGKERSVTRTLQGLIEYFGYTLQVGKSWEREKGNKKINLNPKRVKSLVDNLNQSERNSAANGWPDTSYRVG